MTWLRRNAAPIASVLLAALAVIAAFEILGTFTTAAPPTDPDEAAPELEGIVALAGLIKVTLFLAVPAVITLAVRNRLVRRAAGPNEKRNSNAS